MKSKDQKKRIKALKALDFLRQHPALYRGELGDSLFEGAWFYMAKCCKRGLDEHCSKSMSIYRGEKGWKTLKHKFKKEYKNDSETPKKLQSIYTTYRKFYKEPWVFDHVEYWYETTFFACTCNPYNENACRNFNNWDGFVGPMGGANTFEDAIIQCAKKVKKIYGDFNINRDFLTDEEKVNHIEQQMFKNEDKSPLSFDRNPEYIYVSDAVINLRWLQWFMTTDYCKKQWDFNMSDFAKRTNTLNRMPKERKELVEKYKM